MPTRFQIVIPALLALVLAGCFGGPSLIVSQSYSGPPVRLSSLEGRHLIIFEAPTPGWIATIDRTQRQLNQTRIFLTLRRPDPGILYPRKIVEQRVLSNVPSTRKVVLYARVVDFQDHEKPANFKLIAPTTSTTRDQEP